MSARRLHCSGAAAVVVAAAAVLAALSACSTTPPVPAAPVATPQVAAPGARPTLEFYRTSGSRAPFSPAVRVGDVVYLSGQIGATADGRIPAGLEAQARAAMDNLAAAAKLAGVTLDDVFKCLVMLDDMDQWAAFNRVYVTYFRPERLPARSAFGVDGLALGATLEVECMALAPPATGAR